ncbi:MAG TPA: PIN domain-containing protein [Fimbriimonadaceae bacterium]|nr:PIN domain-containing protein [Fimbriimonadaceae bacterium]
MTDFVLDTNIVLHYSRKNSPVAAQVEADYGIRAARFRPMICAVTLGEMRAFAQGWPADRVESLEAILDELLVIDIHRDDVLSEYARLHKFSADGKELAEKGARGRNISHNDLWIAAAANAVDATVLTTDADLIRLPSSSVRVIQVNSKTGVTEQKVP